jgi:putative ABC transport system ATP-binding protein
MIELENVSRSYQVGPVLVTALDSVSLKISSGEFVVILGPSGSGKTTLLNMVGALDTPTSGEISVAGNRITGASRSQLGRVRRETVSFIFQSFNLFPGLTAVENVQFGIESSNSKSHQTAREMLESVGLGDRANHFPHELSGGEQQRVAIARALATGNPVLLADEPTGELDFTTGAQILQLLREQATEGRVVLVVTHNREISRIADRVIDLSSGKITSDGPPEGGRKEVSELFW